MPTYKELIQQLKDQHCRFCELSLFCASGQTGGQSFWCNHCNGYWAPRLDRLVQCSGFPAMYPRYKWRALNGASMVRAMREHHGRRGCPRCLAGSETRAPTVFGFLAEDGDHL